MEQSQCTRVYVCSGSTQQVLQTIELPGWDQTSRHGLGFTLFSPAEQGGCYRQKEQAFSMLQEQCLVLPATSIKQHFAFKCCALSVPLSTEKGICHALSLDKTASLQNLCFRACWVLGKCCCSSDTPTQVTKLLGKSMHLILNRSQSGCFP